MKAKALRDAWIRIWNQFYGRAWGYTVWRVSRPPGARFQNTPGPAYLYPIYLHESTSPTISDKPLRVGDMTRIDHAVVVSPNLDCLIVVAL
jgi:hypothetical protein